jgi:hypothetical protein
MYVGTWMSTIVAGAKGIGDLTTVTTIASGLPGPVVPLAVDTTASVVYGGVYQDSGAIVRAATSSTGAFETFISNQPNPTSIVVTSGNVYWADLGTSSNEFQDGAVYMCQAGVSCTEPTLLGRGTYCGTMTSDSSYIYFACSGDLYRCPLAGCGQDGPVALASVGSLGVFSLTNDETAFYFSAEYYESVHPAIVKLAK